MFLDSGITGYLKPEQQVSIPPPSGNIVRRRNYIVEGEKVYDVIRFAESKLGRMVESRFVYNILIELMTNTKHHAADKDEKTRPWWLSVYYKEDSNRVSFAFADAGVGIFNSVSPTITFYKKMFQNLKRNDNTHIMRALLSGTFGSRTKVSYRGKGIPQINQYAQNGVIDNLTIISNDVYAAVSRGKIELLNVNFPGTFWYWELNRSALDA